MKPSEWANLQFLLVIMIVLLILVDGVAFRK